MMSFSDFRPSFLNEFKLNQSVAETTQKINQAFGNDSVNEIDSEILTSKMSSEVVDL